MAAPYGNRNAEKWTFRKAVQLFHDAIDMSKQEDYDFIGEIAMDLNVSRHIFTQLADKFKSLQRLYNQLNTNIEANCFKHAKKGKIKEATAIVNLKSNHKWTDRQNLTSDDGTMSPKLIINTGLSKEELKQLINK